MLKPHKSEAFGVVYIESNSPAIFVSSTAILKFLGADNSYLALGAAELLTESEAVALIADVGADSTQPHIVRKRAITALRTFAEGGLRLYAYHDAGHTIKAVAPQKEKAPVVCDGAP